MRRNNLFPDRVRRIKQHPVREIILLDELHLHDESISFRTRTEQIEHGLLVADEISYIIFA